jgi:hypothetical protein
MNIETPSTDIQSQWYSMIDLVTSVMGHLMEERRIASRAVCRVWTHVVDSLCTWPRTYCYDFIEARQDHRPITAMKMITSIRSYGGLVVFRPAHVLSVYWNNPVVVDCVLAIASRFMGEGTCHRKIWRVLSTAMRRRRGRPVAHLVYKLAYYGYNVSMHDASYSYEAFKLLVDRGVDIRNNDIYQVMDRALDHFYDGDQRYVDLLANFRTGRITSDGFMMMTNATQGARAFLVPCLSGSVVRRLHREISRNQILPVGMAALKLQLSIRMEEDAKHDSDPALRAALNELMVHASERHRADWHGKKVTSELRPSDMLHINLRMWDLCYAIAYDTVNILTVYNADCCTRL